MTTAVRSRRLPLTLLALLACLAIALGIAPHYRDDWLLENCSRFVRVADARGFWGCRSTWSCRPRCCTN
jgi:hypothetical protein